MFAPSFIHITFSSTSSYNSYHSIWFLIPLLPLNFVLLPNSSLILNLKVYLHFFLLISLVIGLRCLHLAPLLAIVLRHIVVMLFVGLLFTLLQPIIFFIVLIIHLDLFNIFIIFFCNCRLHLDQYPLILVSSLNVDLWLFTIVLL